MALIRSRTRSVRFTIGLTLGTVALLINPGWACSSDEEWSPDWKYDERDMRHAVEGTYVLEAEDSGDLVTITLSQNEGASLRRTLCASVTRSFLRRAGACGNFALSEMELTAQIESETSEIPSGDYRGLFTVDGTELDQGELQVSVRGDWDLETYWDEDGVHEWHFRLGGGKWLELTPVSASRRADAGVGGP